MKITKSNHDSVNADLRALYVTTITRAQLLEYKAKTGIFAEWLQKGPESNRLGRGLYAVPGDGSTRVVKSKVTRDVVTSRLVPAATEAPAPVRATSAPVAKPMAMSTIRDLANASVEDKMTALAQGASLLAKVPAKSRAFVPFGDYDMVEQVVASRQFFPIFIAGLTGNGKTFGVQQACARTNREYVACSITVETDEDDLLGGFRLRDGNTVFEPGPVVVAMLRGAVLLLDEIDKAGAKIMCLQSIIDGQGVVLKKLGVTITPAPGFTVFATANTKGRGDESGKFITSVLLDEAFLERFPVTVEQEYPSIAVEKKILAKTFECLGFTMTPHAVTFFDTLARWADAIRTTYTEGGIEDVITTRRLCHIVKGYAVFNGDDTKALAYGVNRFDAKTKDAFCELYNKLAPDAANTPSNVGNLDGPTADAPAF